MLCDYIIIIIFACIAVALISHCCIILYKSWLVERWRVWSMVLDDYLTRWVRMIVSGTSCACHWMNIIFRIRSIIIWVISSMSNVFNTYVYKCMVVCISVCKCGFWILFMWRVATVSEELSQSVVANVSVLDRLWWGLDVPAEFKQCLLFAWGCVFAMSLLFIWIITKLYIYMCH